MATTFRIHEDEENNLPTKPTFVPAKLNGKQTRTTLAVLNNVQQRGTKAHASKTGNEVAPMKVKVFNDENEIPKDAKCFGKAIDAVIPVEKFKAFNVIENAANKNAPAKENEVEKMDSTVNTTSFREPLKEIENQETPLSIGDMMSPMSIEKAIIVEDTAERDIRLLHDRFFEVEEYQADIVKYLREAELKNRPKFNYMRKQPDLTSSMRTILVDWLVEVGEEYKLHGETLCLAVSYIDRFLSLMSVIRSKLQLVGTAAMFIASKYEEIYPPEVIEFVYITDNTYTKTQVYLMEQLLLKALRFDLFVPTLHTFLSFYATMTKMSEQCRFLAMYLCELSLLEADPYLKFLPSMISAAAVALARHNLDMPMWSSKLEEATGYTLESLKEVILHLSYSHVAAEHAPQKAVQEKYKTMKYKETSLIPPMVVGEEVFEAACKRYEESEEDINENNENLQRITSTLHFL